MLNPRAAPPDIGGIPGMPGIPAVCVAGAPVQPAAAGPLGDNNAGISPSPQDGGDVTSTA